MFYVYEWYNIDTNEVFYVGKGCNNRYKVVAGRNQDFINYHSTHHVDVRIVKYFDNEQESFDYEELLIRRYKEIGQCFCNKDFGGNGGVSGVWTSEMKMKMSQENPMYAEEQRLRMSAQNPMYNEDTKQKVSLKNSIDSVIINGTEYPSAREAATALNKHIATIWNWCGRGYDTEFNPCRWGTQPQKEYVIKKTCSKAIIKDGTDWYPTVKAAAESVGGNSSNLIKALKKTGIYKGHQFSYANQ